jgi:hypothetical protein
MAENPYAPPRSPLSSQDDRTDLIANVEDRLGSLVGRSFVLFARCLAPISAIVLLFLLPTNLLLEYLSYEVFDPDDFASLLRTSSIIEVFIGPLYSSAILLVLFGIRRGDGPEVGRALRGAVRLWSRVFLARLLAGLVILLGFVALVIPGLYFTVRYALVDVVVVREDLGPVAALARSRELTEGRFWRIAGGVLLLASLPLGAGLLAGALLGAWPAADWWLPSALLDCPLDVAIEVITVFAFLLYCAATPDDPRREAA